MPIRNSPRAIEDLSDLNRLDELVVDKRLGKRASAKKNRRNRHYISVTSEGHAVTPTKPFT